MLADGERRAGDPATLVADVAKEKSELNWQPKYDDREVIVSHAWGWEKKLANIN
jgi:UDP-glucose 4-epimerase